MSDGLCKSSDDSSKISVVKPNNCIDSNRDENSSNSSGSVAFFKANVRNDTPSNIAGPLVDDGAPYSGLRVQKFLENAEDIMIGWNENIDPLPESVRHRPCSQYGKGNHSSTRRRIIGSILLSMDSD